MGNHDYEEGSLQRSPTQVQFKEETATEPPNTKNGRVFKLVVNQPKVKEHARLLVPYVDEKPKHKRQKSQDIYNQAKPEPKPRQTKNITPPKEEKRRATP